MTSPEPIGQIRSVAELTRYSGRLPLELCCTELSGGRGRGRRGGDRAGHQPAHPRHRQWRPSLRRRVRPADEAAAGAAAARRSRPAPALVPGLRQGPERLEPELATSRGRPWLQRERAPRKLLACLRPWPPASKQRL
mmetsp:Transcript_30949/g.53208  ORF Transcript_30949/g.53208 Transcript_30949/m.53208 type:complete len:137 (+) Transcript_30949:178-588(+)